MSRSPLAGQHATNALLVVLLVALLAVVGPLLDGPSEHESAVAVADSGALALRIADMEARMERAASRACRQALGTGEGTTHHWTERNELVCIPPLTNPKGTL